MLALIRLGILGAGLITVVHASRKPTLLDQLTTQYQSTLTDRLELWDDRYQHWIQTHVDTRMVGMLRVQQLSELAQDRSRDLSPAEKKTNRGIILGGFTLVLACCRRFSVPTLTPLLLAFGLIACWPGIADAWRVASQERRFSLLHLTLLFFLWPWISGYYTIGSLGIILGCFASKFQFLTQTVTRNSLSNLVGCNPMRVWVLHNGDEVEIPFDQLQLGDVLILTAGQTVPVDGTIVHGQALIDQHRLTGESLPVEKSEGDPVLAATLVVGGHVQVRVEKSGLDTTAARIVDVLNRTVERQELRISDQFKSVEYTRWPMLGASIFGFVIGGPRKSFTLLGCNFLLAQIPLRFFTLLNALHVGTEHGILIKDGRALDVLSTIDTVVFDKTGTLTLDRQQVVAIHCYSEFSETDILSLAAAAEQRQNHPIAQAVLAEAMARNIELPTLEEAHYELGYGLIVSVLGQKVRVGSVRFMTREKLMITAEMKQLLQKVQNNGQALIFIAIDDRIAGAIQLRATLRSEAQSTIDWLRDKGLRLYILSGDQEAPTRELASQLSIDDYFANILPEQKAQKLQELKSQGRSVCFIGDGINDAIALRQADVSISLRGGTSVATDAAQVVLMDDHLDKLRILWDLAGDMEATINTNNNLSWCLSIASASAVILLPYEYLTVTVLGFIQAIGGIAISQRTLLVDTEVCSPADMAAVIRAR